MFSDYEYLSALSKVELIRKVQDSSEQHKALEFLLDNLHGISWEYSIEEDHFTYVSSGTKRILGYDPDEWTNLESWENMLYFKDKASVTECCKNETHDGKDHTMPYRMVKKDGEIIWVLDVVRLGFNKQREPITLYGFILDITEEKDKELELKKKTKLLEHQANHDYLTGLPNRALFMDRLEQGIKDTRRSKRAIVLFFIDLDYFKEINDTYGHKMGDKVLCEVCEKFKKNTRENDTLSRLGGDEFTVILKDIKNKRDVMIIAQKFLNIFKKPFLIDGVSLKLSASIGISVFIDRDITAEDLLNEADTAMYKAKENGKASYDFFEKELFKYSEIIIQEEYT